MSCAGGKAKKAKLSAATQYRMDASAVESSHALTALNLTSEASAYVADMDASRLVPPFNKSAETPADAFPLDRRELPRAVAMPLRFIMPLRQHHGIPTTA